MASTPARMMTSEQTVARMGRRMKVSTNMRYQVSGVRFQEVSGLRFHRHAVLQLLDVRNDHLLALLDAAPDDIAVANQIADRDRLLPRDDAALPLFGDEHEVLAAHAVDRDYGHRDRRGVARHESAPQRLLHPDARGRLC